MSTYNTIYFESQILQRTQKNEDFQIIFDYLPKISGYQIAIVLITAYSEIAAGALQLAQIILQASPGDFTISQQSKQVYNRFQNIWFCFLDSQICIESRSFELNLTQDGCDSSSACIAYNYSSQAGLSSYSFFLMFKWLITLQSFLQKQLLPNGTSFVKSRFSQVWYLQFHCVDCLLAHWSSDILVI